MTHFDLHKFDPIWQNSFSKGNILNVPVLLESKN